MNPQGYIIHIVKLGLNPSQQIIMVYMSKWGRKSKVIRPIHNDGLSTWRLDEIIQSQTLSVAKKMYKQTDRKLFTKLFVRWIPNEIQNVLMLQLYKGRGNF